MPDGVGLISGCTFRNCIVASTSNVEGGAISFESPSYGLILKDSVIEGSVVRSESGTARGGGLYVNLVNLLMVNVTCAMQLVPCAATQLVPCAMQLVTLSLSNHTHEYAFTL
jgi:hypothetical protein